jgi:hypothetical protein
MSSGITLTSRIEIALPLLTNTNAINPFFHWTAPPHPALSPKLGERGRVRGLNGKMLNAFVLVRFSLKLPAKGLLCYRSNRFSLTGIRKARLKISDQNTWRWVSVNGLFIPE